MTDKKILTKKELAIIEFKAGIYNTVNGKMSVASMLEQFGTPKGVIKMAKVEVRYKSTVAPTIIVDRQVDCELHFSKDIIVREVKKTILTELASSVDTVYVRHPTYNGLKMPNATKTEIKRFESTLNK